MTTIDLSSNIYLRLDSATIQYFTDINFTTPINIIAWPTTFTNNTGTNKTVFITNKLEMISATMYFNIGSDNITIDGQNNIVEINGLLINGYPGLVRNGTISVNGKNNIIIKNLGVTASNNSRLTANSGWIGQRYMNKGRGTTCQVINCYSRGNIIGISAGAIFGQSSSGTALNCYSIGDIIGAGAGGICGAKSSGTATNCYSTGDIYGPFAGGIFGGGILGQGSTGIATNCYSTGDIIITAISAGGIFGQGSSGITTNCYIANGNWTDSDALSELINGPTYSGTTLTGQGSVWIDYDLLSPNTPWLLKSFITLASFSLLPLSINEREIYSGSLISDSLYSGSLPIGSTIIPQYTIISQPIDNLYISGNTVNAKYPFNYREYKNYPVQISGTVNGITIVQSFNIQIVNLPDAPTLVYISNNQIPENGSIDSVVGTLLASDPDSGDTFTYQFASGVGSEDNLSFTIENEVLYTATILNYNTKNTYSIRVKTTDSSALSVENPILLHVVIPTVGSFETSGLVGSSTTITLQGQNVAGGALVYEINKQPEYGSLIASDINGVFSYVPNSNTLDSFEYVVKEDTMTSLPGRVIIYNYSESDISNLQRNLGTLEFDTISFDGNRWTFGTITTDTFIQDELYYKLGKMTLTN